jgi:flagellar basal body P-ring protein FlgI
MTRTHHATGQALPFRLVFSRAGFFRGVILVLLVLIAVPGCRNFFKRSKKEQFEIEAELMAAKLADPDRPRLIGEVARASGINVRRYEALGLVTNLPGTGGIVRPSTQREVMLEEIRRNGVVEAEEILDSPATATAKLSVFANACDVKGDIVDVIIESSSECTATDLREGYLMESHLFEYFSLTNKQLRRSNEKAIASGELLIYPQSYSKEKEFNALKGVILGGAKLRDSSRLAVIFK